MKIKLLAFGIAGEIVGSSSSMIEVPDDCDIDYLREYLAEKYPALITVLAYAIAVNKSYVQGNMLLGENDEVAIIPPVSGG